MRISREANKRKLAPLPAAVMYTPAELDGVELASRFAIGLLFLAAASSNGTFKVSWETVTQGMLDALRGRVDAWLVATRATAEGAAYLVAFHQ